MVATAIIVVCAILRQTMIALGIVLAPGEELLCSIRVGSVALILPMTAFRIVPAPGVAQHLGIVAACATTIPPMTVSKIAPVCGVETRWRMSVAPVMTTLPTIVF